MQLELEEYVKRIKKITDSGGSEAKLEGEVNQILKECLAEYDIDFDPNVNTSLSNLGLCQIDASRPDGVFGHIIYDYKSPNSLNDTSTLKKSKQQLEGYLKSVTNEKEESNPNDWIGYLFDGNSIFYCQKKSNKWIWSPRRKLSENSLSYLIRIHRSLNKKPLTPEFLSTAFGKNATVAQNTIRELCNNLSNPSRKTQMLFREWKRLFEQVSTYELDQLPSLKKWASENRIESTDASEILFSLHTYYSIVVKILTSELLSVSTPSTFSLCQKIANASDEEEIWQLLKQLESSEYYRNYQITNFLEGDFFSWYISEQNDQLANTFRNLAIEFLDFEPSSPIFKPEIKQDLLKVFYTSLVDEQIRHDLGEYYTPDWLAQHLIETSGYSDGLNESVLDPACGSGTFLVECIKKIRSRAEDEDLSGSETISAILNNVKGLDLNPLAVISSRANYILSINDLIFELGHEIEVPVYLADSINIPVEKEDEDGNKFLDYLLETEVEDFELRIPYQLVDKQVLSHVLLHCEDCIRRGDDKETFIRLLKNDDRVSELLEDSVIQMLEDFFNKIESLEQRNWNRIWCRIIKNNFSTKSFDSFDYILGNPPWVRWSRLPTSYRNRVKEFCNYYGLVSGRGYTGGIESDISTVITFSAADNWLKDNGKVAFLITWTVFKSGSAKGFREGKLPDSKGLRIKHIEDLSNIQAFPYANNETSIYIAEKTDEEAVEFEDVPCKIWNASEGSSRVNPYSSLEEVYARMDIYDGAACPIREFGSPLFTGDKTDFDQSHFLRGSSDYYEDAHRGTVTDLARLYWVKVEKYSSETNKALIRTFTEDEYPRAKKVNSTDGFWIEADLLYPLIRGRNVGRYSHEVKGWYQIIPNDHYSNMLDEVEFASKYPQAYKYFNRNKDLLLKRSSYRRYQDHLPFYSIYCIGDYSFSPYKVVWLEQQNPNKFRASVIGDYADSVIPNKNFVPDHKLYFVGFDDPVQAHYLCGFLNSKPVRKWLGGFLLGKQIGTTIFEYMKIPTFDKDNPDHQEIANISEQLHENRNNTMTKKPAREKLENQLIKLVKKVC
ncbi:N-6 DNA methylase [Fodinibius sp. SL11]|uniref:N-6 DNA methylase n=1 Tax=Fodinibius sp. SL11 TaxID=3425690 RepID=UPI003F8854AF